MIAIGPVARDRHPLVLGELVSDVHAYEAEPANDEDHSPGSLS